MFKYTPKKPRGSFRSQKISMFTYVLSFSFLLFFSFSELSCFGHGSEIILTGNVDTAIMNKFASNEMVIKIYDPVKELNNEGEMIRVKLDKEGKFRTNIPVDKEINYFGFCMQNESLTNKISPGAIIPINFPERMELGSNELYLFESGDQIGMTISKGGIFNFSGTNSEKLNCQAQIFKLNGPNTLKVDELRDNYYLQKRYTDFFKLKQSAMNLDQKLNLSILNSFRENLNDQIYNILSVNAGAYPELKMLSSFFILFLDPGAKAEGATYYSRYFKREIEENIDTTLVTNSVYYPLMAFQKEWTPLKIFTPGKNKNFLVDSLYDRITSNYSGRMRDELLLMSFKELNKTSSEQVKLKLDQALNTITTPSYKQALAKWKREQFTAFPFELEDVNGKSHKLSDYKGKVIVMDFWFTNCGWCVNLNAAMHTIIERYKNNPDIVFMTVCEDKNKDQWIKSLETNAYTSPGTINLYTNGLGGEHPIMKYYNFQGGPWQVVIDKNGQLVTSRPPRPSDGIQLFGIDPETKKYKAYPDDQVTMKNPNAIAFMKLLDESLAIKTHAAK
ncbi:thioredoxin family protein [Pedobacter sp. BAL39]|uniref:TlpA family protein disulfide reductase n=1 Tax=Pedobacter sp. BAL39 TaxID=391596 RepID=UPI0001559343|nr:TlpA disulfide reductase family protein [Pedobacter sp. BAL39]EDM35375.1 thioredoxin family protein [Pedobacter sp. BAL39]